MRKGNQRFRPRLLASGFFCAFFLLSGSMAFAGWTGLIPPDAGVSWSLSKMSFASPAEGWAVGEDLLNGTGLLLEYSSGSWRAIPPPDVSGHWALFDVYFPASGEGWAVGTTDGEGGKGVLLHFSGGTWAAVPTPVLSPSWSLSGVHFPSTGSGWFVGTDAANSRGALLHYADGLFSIVVDLPFVSSDWELRGVHFPSPSEGWAVGSDKANGKGVLLHYSDGFWENVTPPDVSSDDWELRSVHFVSVLEGWAVGKDTTNGRGVLLHYTGGLWQSVLPPAIGGDWELNDIRLTSNREGWAVGADALGGSGVLLHFVDGTWSRVAPPTISSDWGLLGMDMVSPYQGIASGWDRINGKGVLLQYLAPSPEMVVEPNALNFGNVMIGSFSEQVIRVKNEGFFDLILYSVTEEMEPPFSRVGGGCESGTVLPPGEECVMVLQFTPTSVGTFSSGITLISNDLYQPEFVISLEGGSGPDLFGQWTEFSQECKTKRDEIRCKTKAIFEVRNTGNFEASSFVVRFYLSADSNLDEEEDLFIGRQRIGKLKPITSKDVKLKFKLDRGETATGKYLFALVDVNDEVVEADETNNLAVFGPIP